MTAPRQILLVGSLPPATSNAAVLTAAVAASLAEEGVDVAIMIDALAPPPDHTLTIPVLRPFSEPVREGQYQDWPRLYIVGSGPDSLPVLRQMERAPGPVLCADESLFPLVLPWLEGREDRDETLTHWLAEHYGDAGRTLAQGICVHRRYSKDIGREIPAFDLLLQKATTCLALSPQQELSLRQAGRETVAVNPLAAAVCSPVRPAAMPDASTVLVIGAVGDHQPALEGILREATRSSTEFSCRYSTASGDRIAAADVVLILDGHEAAYCPLAVKTIGLSKPLICADQAWANHLPKGAVLPVSHAEAHRELAVAVGALMRQTGLREAIGAPANDVPIQKPETTSWSDDILKAASGAEPLALAPSLRPPLAVSEPSGIAAADRIDGAWALIGAVPAPAILQQRFPDLALDVSPRFLSPELAIYLAELTGEPLLCIHDYLGFEAPFIETASQTDLPGAGRKARTWPQVRADLLQAQNALTFGCSVDKAASSPPANLRPVEWSFHIPLAAVPDPHFNKMFDAESGVFWRYDRTSQTLTLLLLVGSSGSLALTCDAAHPLIATDDQSTRVLSVDGPAEFQIQDHGVAIFRLALCPDPGGRADPMIKTLAETGLRLKWSPT